MLVDFIVSNWIEISGALISLVYLYFSIRQNIWLWFFGLLSAVFYSVIFFDSKFYADMALQSYYIVISIYGWITWRRATTRTVDDNTELVVGKTPVKIWVICGWVFMLLWGILYFILHYFTDSDLPIGDAFTTAGSIVATWMLARKYLEHWLIWIIVDLVSMVLYIYKGLYPTTILFAVYTLMAIAGYRSWKKSMEVNQL